LIRGEFVRGGAVNLSNFTRRRGLCGLARQQRGEAQFDPVAAGVGPMQLTDVLIIFQ
jgi:hypothetical protein